MSFNPDEYTFGTMARIMNLLRPDLFSVTEAYDTVVRWAKDLHDTEDAVSISSGGFELTYDRETGCYELGLFLWASYDDNDSFNWTSSYQPIDWNDVDVVR